MSDKVICAIVLGATMAAGAVGNAYIKVKKLEIIKEQIQKTTDKEEAKRLCNNLKV